MCYIVVMRKDRTRLLSTSDAQVELKKRGIDVNRSTIWRWCRDKLLVAEFKAGSFLIHDDSLRKFKPPVRGNPDFGKAFPKNRMKAMPLGIKPSRRK